MCFPGLEATQGFFTSQASFTWLVSQLGVFYRCNALLQRSNTCVPASISLRGFTTFSQLSQVVASFRWERFSSGVSQQVGAPWIEVPLSGQLFGAVCARQGSKSMGWNGFSNLPEENRFQILSLEILENIHWIPTRISSCSCDMTLSILGSVPHSQKDWWFT